MDQVHHFNNNNNKINYIYLHIQFYQEHNQGKNYFNKHNKYYKKLL